MSSPLVAKHTLISDTFFTTTVVTPSSNTCLYYFHLCSNNSDFLSHCHISHKYTETSCRLPLWYFIFMAVTIFHSSSNDWHILDKFLAEVSWFSFTFYISTSLCNEGITAVSAVNDLATSRQQPTEIDSAVLMWSYNKIYFHRGLEGESIWISDAVLTQTKSDFTRDVLWFDIFWFILMYFLQKFDKLWVTLKIVHSVEYNKLLNIENWHQMLGWMCLLFDQIFIEHQDSLLQGRSESRWTAWLGLAIYKFFFFPCRNTGNASVSISW